MSANPHEAPKQGGRNSEASNSVLRWIFYVPFIAGLGFYIAAIPTAGSVLAEILSDVGNAIMLSTAVLLLIQIYASGDRAASYGNPDKEG